MTMMRKTLLILLYMSVLKNSISQSLYAGYPVFAGSDLGLTYTKNASAFRIWSPTAEAARILLYDEGKGGEATQTLPLLKGEQGSWYILIPGDLKNTSYTYQVWINGVWSKEITDPY